MRVNDADPNRDGAVPAHRLVVVFASLPRLTRIGLILLTVGFVVDAFYHLTTGSTSLRVPCCGPGYLGHLVTVAGMVLSVAGVLYLALRRDRRAVGPDERRK